MTLILNQQASNFRKRVNEYLEGLSFSPEQIISVDGYSLQMELASHQVGACFCPQQMLRKGEIGRVDDINDVVHIRVGLPADEGIVQTGVVRQFFGKIH